MTSGTNVSAWCQGKGMLPACNSPHPWKSTSKGKGTSDLHKQTNQPTKVVAFFHMKEPITRGQGDLKDFLVDLVLITHHAQGTHLVFFL